jgi:hypothetical protein
MQSTLSRLVLFAAVSTSPRARGLSTAAVKRSPIPILNADQQNMSSSNNNQPKTWCCTASVNSEGSVTLETIADGVIKDNDHVSKRKVADQLFDLTQSVDWMEHLEKTEKRENDEGGAGAYDTMRCDIILSKKFDGSSSEQRVHVWGQDYHLQRLDNSYQSLLQEKNKAASKPDLPLSIPRDVLKGAMQQSERIISELLAEAESSVSLADSEDDTLIQLFRVTLLWSSESPGPIEAGSNDSILVRGHATSSCNPLKVHRPPEPIVVSVAAHSTYNKPTADDDEAATAIDKSLPTRFSNPKNKVASWCRLRKQMEKPTYKPPGASEVLMVRPRLDEDSKSRLEVLEGLSSNFFAIYKDGTLRTATQGVLNGYVRHLVLGCANNVDLKFDPRPIFLHDADEWKETFITSSSRLIYPISRVLLPEDDHDSTGSAVEGAFSECWNYEPDGKTPKWQELLQEILKAGGYEDKA